MKGVSAFLLLAFGLSFVIWEGLIAKGWTPGSPDRMGYALYGAFGPAIAAFAVRILVTREGFADAGLRPDMIRRWRHYLFAWLYPLPVAGVVLLLAQITGLARVDWTFSAGLAELAGQSADPSFLAGAGPLSIVANSLAAAVPAALILFGEEFGWRGYLQLRLFPSRPLAAAVAVGLVWTLWHLPLALRGYNYPENPMLGAMVFAVAAVLLSVVFGWLRLASGSIWPACLAHAATNAVGASLVGLAVGGDHSVVVSYFGVLGWVPLGALAAWIVVTGRLAPAPQSEAAPGPEANGEDS